MSEASRLAQAQPQAGAPTGAWAELLSRVTLFSRLDRVTRARLASHLEPIAMPKGAVVCRQGDAAADGLYIITRGAFGVFAATRGGVGEVRLGTQLPGDWIGEMALVTGEPHAATVRAESDGEVLRLERAHFLELVGQNPAVPLAIAATLAQRLRDIDAELAAVAPARGLPGAPHRAPEAPAVPHGQGARATPPAEAAAATPPARARPAWLHRRPGRSALGLALAGAVLAGGWIVPPPPGLAAPGWHALVVVIALVPLLALAAIPDAVAALAVAAAWVLGGVTSTRVAMGGFATGTWVLVVSVMGVGAAVAASGAVYRLALWAVTRIRGGFTGQALALGTAGLVVSPAIPYAAGRVTLIAPAATELVEAVGYARGSRAAAGLAMASLMGFGQMVGGFLTSSTTALLVYAALPASSRAGLDWGSWAIRAAPVHALLFVGVMGAVLWLYRPRPGDPAPGGRRADSLALQRTLLGPLSPHERIALAVAGALVLGFATQPWHGVEPAWVGVLALVVLGATGALTLDTLRAVNWNFTILFGVLTSMTEVFAQTGVDRWLGTVLVAAVGGLMATPILFVGALTLLCYGISLILRWPVAAPLVTIALAPVAGDAGIDPWVVGMVALIACNGFFLPYQSVVYLALYEGTGGRLFTHRQARPAALAYGVVTLVALCASVPVWHAMGLL